MISEWVKGLPPDKAKDFEQYLRNSTLLLSRLSELLDDLDQQCLKTSKSDYDKPGWPYYRADLDGQRRMISKLKQLITL